MFCVLTAHAQNSLYGAQKQNYAPQVLHIVQMGRAQQVTPCAQAWCSALLILLFVVHPMEDVSKAARSAVGPRLRVVQVLPAAQASRTGAQMEAV